MSAPTYVRSGRGGAGNFAPKAVPKPVEVEMKSQNDLQNVDLEAQKPSDPADANSVLDAPGSTPAPQYKTYARGGAGNWYEPATLKQTGTFTTGNTVTETAASENTEMVEKRSSRVWQGRGGAGNWEADQQIQEDIKRKSLMLNEDARAALRDIKEEAKVDAEKEIKAPQMAHIHVPHLDRHQNLGDEVHDI